MQGPEEDAHVKSQIAQASKKYSLSTMHVGSYTQAIILQLIQKPLSQTIFIVTTSITSYPRKLVKKSAQHIALK